MNMLTVCGYGRTLEENRLYMNLGEALSILLDRVATDSEEPQYQYLHKIRQLFEIERVMLRHAGWTILPKTLYRLPLKKRLTRT